MQHVQDRSADVEQAAERLRRPGTRGALAAKRALDVVLALVMLLALAPALLVAGLLSGGGLERRVRLGRDGAPIAILRFSALPGPLGRALERAGVRDAPLLLCVLAGRLSLVGPRVLPPGAGSGHTGPRRLMAPGLIGPARRCAADERRAGELDDAYVVEWSLWGDVRMLLGLRAPRPASSRFGH